MTNSIRYACVFLLLCLEGLYCIKAGAQTSQTVLTGSIAIKESGTYPYKIQFTDSAGIISGVSVSDAGGADETRAVITGKVNRSGKELIFHETKVLSTKSGGGKANICLVHAKLKLKGKAMYGSFTGLMPDGKTKCGSGEMVLYSKDDIIRKLMGMGIKVDSTITRSTPKDTGVRYAPPRPSLSLPQLLPGQSTELMTDVWSVHLELWDDAHIDGDIVTVKHNGDPVLSHARLTGKKIKLDIELAGTDTISLVAVNEGSEPTNTAMLKVVLGKETYQLKASSRINEPVYIIIRRKKP